MYWSPVNRKFRREEKKKTFHWPKVTFGSLSTNEMSSFFFEPVEVHTLRYSFNDYSRVPNERPSHKQLLIFRKVCGKIDLIQV